MTTAPENRGGMRLTAPQNNPANVSGTGGAGQSGRVAQGYAYGMNKQINDQVAGAPLAKGPTFNAGSSPTSAMSSMPPATTITAPTELPDQSIMDGAPIGDGNNSIPGLPQPVPGPDNTQFNAAIQAYYPVLSYIASRPETSTETRNVLSALMNGI